MKCDDCGLEFPSELGGCPLCGRNVRRRETARLKRLLAERDLEIDALKELLAKKW